MSLSPHFCFLNTENALVEYIAFFSFFIKIKNIIKKAELDYLSIFSQFLTEKENFLSIMSNYQNFLTLLLYYLGDPEQLEERNEKGIDVLVHMMRVFEVFYKINENFDIVSYKEFHNESVNNNLNIKEECRSYFKILQKKSKGEKGSFSIIKYHWLFNTASKSEILLNFNLNKQRTEMMNSFNDILNDLNVVNMINMYLYLEVRRNNLIEDTLNFISNPNINLKKALKVKFVGEQGIDEGGVKKEFFLLLIRQLFDPNYSMFTYDEKNRFFWFNPNSFESKIKFELIGIILGLAFFNNVILDIKFPLVIYKKLLHLKPVLSDLKEIDPDLHQNLNYLLTTKETGLKEKLGTTFSVIVDHFGHKEVVPLKVNKYFKF